MSILSNIQTRPVAFEAMPALRHDELTEFVPAMHPKEYEALKDSIRTRGYDLSQPILLRKANGTWKIVDGRNRYAACLELDVMPTFVEFQAPDEVVRELAFERNIPRRHLSPMNLAASEILEHDGTEIATMSPSTRKPVHDALRAATPDERENVRALIRSGDTRGAEAAIKKLKRSKALADGKQRAPQPKQWTVGLPKDLQSNFCEWAEAIGYEGMTPNQVLRDVVTKIGDAHMNGKEVSIPGIGG